MPNQSFTFGSEEFMHAIKAEQYRRGGNYEIGFNRTDFEILITILQGIALYGEIDRHKLNHLIGWENTDDIDPIEDWAWGWLSSIGETLGVEGI